MFKKLFNINYDYFIKNLQIPESKFTSHPPRRFLKLPRFQSVLRRLKINITLRILYHHSAQLQNYRTDYLAVLYPKVIITKGILIKWQNYV